MRRCVVKLGSVFLRESSALRSTVSTRRESRTWCLSCAELTSSRIVASLRTATSRSLDDAATVRRANEPSQSQGCVVGRYWNRSVRGGSAVAPSCATPGRMLLVCTSTAFRSPRGDRLIGRRHPKCARSASMLLRALPTDARTREWFSLPCFQPLLLDWIAVRTRGATPEL